ncbi:lantibiotic dehydratase [Mucilaginibacter ginsenosidivorans]|uniref:Lantibiotic dehydratase n=1 Tax=Mucilaginibacter ginsenosidivorans TaxID=398053 RepID=A0A5B8UTS9_9SPHI|nr:lantibiotic dehydratase [Mucilaginibacter ginsenosidivorans]QEC62530.1 hypothetical protein FRZ54_07985 [Mucilaginibacter ginsenosidivorans]
MERDDRDKVPGGMDPALVMAEGLLLREPLFGPGDYAGKGPAGLLAEPLFRQALWLASPQFYRALEKLGFDWERLDAGKRLSLKKYMNRACFRPTPFGAFASFAVTGWGTGGGRGAARETWLHLLPSRELELAALRLSPPGEGELLALNPALYRAGKGYRYVFSEVRGDGALKFWLNALDAGPAHRLLFRWLGRGPLPLGELAGRLSGELGCDLAEALGWLRFLLGEQVLLGAADPGLLRGEEAAVPGLPGWGELAGFFGRFEPGALGLPERGAALEKVLPGSLRRGDGAYDYALLERTGGRGPSGPGCRERLLEAVGALRALGLPGGIRPLEEFVREFKKRYDRGKVPLLEALDPDQGIGYDVPPRAGGDDFLLAGLVFPDTPGAGVPPAWTAAHRLLFRLWRQAPGRSAFGPLCLSREDILELEGQAGAEGRGLLPASLGVLFREADGGLLWLERCGGPSAVALAGRFSVCSDAVYGLCREVARLEEAANPGVVFAEVAQLSGGHIDNINRRRQVYDRVIPVNVFPRAGGRGVLLPSDLLLSVQGEELVLESAALGMRVVPRLPTAYNYRHNELALFRLLCDLQYPQPLGDLALDLERFFPGEDFYPRVEYRGVVLAAAKWRLAKGELEQLRAAPRSLGRLHLFRERRGLPALVATGFGDRQLVFDLSRDEEAWFFLEQLAGKEGMLIEEVPGGRPAVAQYLGFLVRRDAAVLPLPRVPAVPAGVQRRFLPGSEWLFVKLFCTPRVADELLAGVVAPFIRENRGVIRRWFFIRYAEGGYHIRLRLMGEPAALAALLPALHGRLRRWAGGRMVKAVQGDVYDRELERYGAGQIGLAEACFEAESVWVLEQLAGRGSGAAVPVELAVLALVWLMSEAMLGERAGDFFRAMGARFLAEYREPKALKRSLDEKFRGMRPAMEGLLAGEALRVYAGKAAVRRVLSCCLELYGATGGWAERKRLALVADLVHMLVNRLFRSSQLDYELAVYYLLGKYERSPAGRLR